MSVGVTGKSYSLSGAFTTMGKLTVIVMFLLGKNRALPEISDPVVSFSFPELEAALDLCPVVSNSGSPKASNYLPSSVGSRIDGKGANVALDVISEESDEDAFK